MRLPSVLLISLLVFSGCSSGPKVTICVSNPQAGVFECHDPKDGAFVVPFDQSENYIAMPPKDFQALIEYAKRKCFK